METETTIAQSIRATDTRARYDAAVAVPEIVCQSYSFHTCPCLPTVLKDRRRFNAIIFKVKDVVDMLTAYSVK